MPDLASSRELTTMGNARGWNCMAVRVIPLASAPGEGASWERSRWLVYLWGVVELLVVTNPWQVSSRLRCSALRLFGAKIGPGVIFRPRTRVRFPWKLSIGTDCWIGEGVWIHNQDNVTIDHDVVISQETLITTGSHAVREDMALITRAIRIEAGAWITSRCLILGGAYIGRSSVIHPMSVVRGRIPENAICAGNPATVVGDRFAPRGA